MQNDKKNQIKSDMLTILRKIDEQQFAWPFREPVDTTDVKDYLNVISNPIDLSTIEKRVRKGDWYKTMQMLRGDLLLIVSNCKKFNDPASTYYEAAESLQKFINTLFPDGRK